MSDASLPLPSSATADAAAVSAPASVAATHCLTCGEGGARHYCPSCGQRVIGGRFTLRKIAVDGVNEVLDLDRGLLFTAVQLSRRPGEAIREYVSGRTVRFSSPVKYFLLMAALTTLLYLNTGLAEAMSAAWTSPGAADPSLNAMQANATEFFTRWMNLIMAAGLPFSAAATWLFFRRAGYNLAEHLIFNTYVYAHVCLLFVAFSLPALAGAGVSAVMAAYMVASLAYSAWAGVGFFGGPPARTALRSVVANVLGYVAYMVFAFVVAVAGMVVYMISKQAGA